MLHRLTDYRRQLNGLGFVVCALMIAFAYYLQYFQHMEPCPLCIFQRLVFFAIGVVFLLATIFHPAGIGGRVFSGLTAMVSGIGIAIAGRHVWLQSRPADQIVSCSADFGYLSEFHTRLELMVMMLGGTGECGKIDRFLGVSLPTWALFLFIVLGAFGVLVNWRSVR
ncbi:disulfide bond formation protein B [Alkalilimnicola ehrlichii]|nr:disulfide bond formation protein B [Alkalilimnicola ehrlichii]